MTIAAALSACTGTGNGADITKGVSKGSETTATNSCGALVGTQTNTLTTTTKWTVKPAKPKLNPSTVVFTTEIGNVGPPVSFDAAGSVTAGSFVGNSAGTHAVIQETVFDHPGTRARPR